MCRWLVYSLVLLAPLARAGEQDTLHPFPVYEQQFRSYFAGLKDHRTADLLSREQIKPLLDEFQRAGWKVADREEILADVLSDRDPLVKRLGTKSGKKFMRQAAGFPQAYDRLDHLERLSDGKRILDRLVDGPDGYKLIEYLTSSAGGKNMGAMLAHAPKGADFNKPTGRIYTQDQLLTRLKASYAKHGAMP